MANRTESPTSPEVIGKLDKAPESEYLLGVVVLLLVTWLFVVVELLANSEAGIIPERA